MILNGSADQHILLESSLHCKKDGGIESLVALIQQKESDSDFLTEVKTTHAVCVPAGHHVQIKCCAKTPADDQIVYFSPILSESENELTFSETVCKLRRVCTDYVLVDVTNTTKGIKCC